MDRFANDIGARYELTEVLFPGLPDVRKRVAKALSGQSSSKPQGLEIGCGTGLSTQLVLDAAPQAILHLVDVNNELLSIARRRLDRERIAEFACSDAVEFLGSLASASFDFCFTVYALHNFDAGSRRTLLQHVKRVLRPQGLFVWGDRFFAADADARMHQLEEDLRRLCEVLQEPADSLLLRDWIKHLLDDICPERLQKFDEAHAALVEIGFQVSVEPLGNGIDFVMSASAEASHSTIREAGITGRAT